MSPCCFLRAILARGGERKKRHFLFPYSHFSFPWQKQNGGHNTENPYVRIRLHCKLQAHGHCYFEITRRPGTTECRPFLKWMLKWYSSFYRRTGHLMFAKTFDRLLAMQTSCWRQRWLRTWQIHDPFYFQQNLLWPGRTENRLSSKRTQTRGITIKTGTKICRYQRSC